MNFTTDEKVAIISILIELMNADSDVSRGEIAYMTQLRVIMNIDSNTVEKAKAQDSISSLHIIRGMSDDKKTALTLMMIEMMKADGKIHKGEMEAFILIANICNLPIAKDLVDAQQR